MHIDIATISIPVTEKDTEEMIETCVEALKQLEIQSTKLGVYVDVEAEDEDNPEYGYERIYIDLEFGYLSELPPSLDEIMHIVGDEAEKHLTA